MKNCCYIDQGPTTRRCRRNYYSIKRWVAISIGTSRSRPCHSGQRSRGFYCHRVKSYDASITILVYKTHQICQRTYYPKGSFVKYVTRKGEWGVSLVVLRSYLKTWVKCGKRVTRGGRGSKNKSKNCVMYFTNDP